jgi:guanylate kinase
MAEATGRVVVLSGPSGAGKSTVVRRLLAACQLPLRLSVSATTRPPRAGERDGVDYHFLAASDFQRRRDAGEFLEWKEVFGRGDFYGTLRAEVVDGLQAGAWMILEIDVEGAAVVREAYPDAITVFIHPGSLEELERRLRFRGTESEASLQRRLEVARRELDCLRQYRYEVVNDDVDRAADEICRILLSHVGGGCLCSKN